MTSENTAPTLSPDQIAKSFDYPNFAIMAQHETVPNRTRILGVGATAAILGEEFAFFRSDIHWTNVAPEYADSDTPPIVDVGQDNNIEFETWDLLSLSDIFPEEHFDRIYCHGSDLADFDPQTLRKFGKTLVGLLARGGVLHVAKADSEFIENGVYRKTTSNLTFSKPKTSIAEPYLTHIPNEKTSFINRLQHHGLPRLEQGSIKPLDAMSNFAARAIMAGYRTAGALFEYSRRKK